jgi:hypothetical protein
MERILTFQAEQFDTYSEFDEYEYEEHLDDELDLDEMMGSIGTEPQYFASPISMPSCEPGRFETGKLNVVKWWKRTTPGKREIPKDKKIAILSRGRIALPFENIKWLLDEGKTGIEWVSRLPDKIDTLFPEIDVTIELWMAIKGKVTTAEDATIFSEWNKYRLQELTNCRYLLGRSYTANRKTLAESKLRLRGLGINLDGLYKAAGVPFSGPPIGKDAPFIEVFLLYIYVTFPKDLEKFLKPLVRPPSKEGQRKRLASRLLRLTDKIGASDPNRVRKKHVLCILRKLTADIVDGKKVDDSYRPFPNRLPLGSKTLSLHFTEQLIDRYLDAEDAALIRGINTLYKDMVDPIETLVTDLQQLLIELTADPLRGGTREEVLRKTAECKRAAFFLSKARDRRSIYSCLATWILLALKECDFSE